tara:strand:- start:1645 stop:5328 length:3684 start_codon:yes stop_codon:yes gene_type:complete
MKKINYIFIIISLFFNSLSADTITTAPNVNNTFFPDTLIVYVGDTVTFIMGPSHNAVEVSENTWLNDGTTSNGGFDITYGQTGTFIPLIDQTYYYVCQPHVLMGMKAVIIANQMQIPGCTDSLALNYDSLATVDDGSCLYSFTDCNGILNGASLLDSCGICQQSFIFNVFTQTLVQYVSDTNNLNLSSLEILVMPNDLSNNASIWNTSCTGCTDPLALNYDSTSTIDDGSCNYSPVLENIFFSEYAEGSGGGTGRYFEIYNPSTNIVDLTNYAFARVDGAPTDIGVYETWHNFDSGAVILPNDVYVVAHSGADNFIQLEADMNSDDLSNGDDGMALVYGTEPLTPTHPDSGLYQILDWIGDWNGDPGQAWDVAGTTAGTRNHTLVRKCNVVMGDTSWTNASGTDALNSQWIVFGNNNWNYVGSHSNSPSYSTDSVTICNGLSITVNGNMYDSTGVYSDTLVNFLGCDSVITTYLDVLSISASFLNITDTICDGTNVFVGNSIYSQSGIYYDTLTNSVGCDSIIITNLTVQTPIFQDITICDGDSINVGNSTYSQAGSYVDSLISSIGCDSIIYTNLTVYSPFNSILGGMPDNSVGGGGFFTGDQHLLLDVYSPANIVSATVYSDGATIYEFELRDNNGNTLADTIYFLSDGANTIQLNFEVPAGNDFELGISPASSFDGLYRNNQGVNYPYNFGSLASITSSSAGGNFYYFFYNIEIKGSNVPQEYSICDGDSVFVGNSIYTTTGSYIDSLISYIGCDSVVSSNVTVNPTVFYVNNQTVCADDVYVFGSNVYDSTGVYIDTLQTSFGCDSIITTNLIVDTITASYSINNATICFGNNVFVGNSIYSSSGTYSDTIIAANGCDSVITTNLTVLSANYLTLFGGITDSASAEGDYYDGDQHLLFDCYVPSTIVSALIYSEDSAVVTFELRDNNGIVIDNSIQQVFPGSQRVALDFYMPVGNDYQLGTGDLDNSPLFRSNTDVNFPYNFGNIASITQSSVANFGDYYYFYYDIELMPYGVPQEYELCTGDSVLVGNNFYTSSGSYIDSLSASNSCDSVLYSFIKFNDPVPVYISTDPLNGEICLGDDVVLFATSGFNAYSWSNGMSSAVVIDSPIADQLYSVTAVDASGCSSYNEVWVYVDSCINSTDDEHLHSLSIYPNPSNGLINISSNYSNEINIEIYNSIGDKVFTRKHLNTSINTRINLLKLPAGVYLMKLISDGKYINRKVVIK